MNQYFKPTIPADFTLNAASLEIAGGGDYLSAEFIRCIHDKIGLILASLLENRGELLVWSDIDIQFFDLSAVRLAQELGDYDIAFQREGANTPDINSVFLSADQTIG